MTVSSGSMSIGVLAILTGLVGSYAFRQFLTQEQPVAEAKPQTVIVPQATQNLPAERVVLLRDIGLARMTEAEIKAQKYPSYFTDATQIIGLRLREPVRQGQPFPTTSVYLEGEQPNITSKLKNGMRPVTLPVSEMNMAGLFTGCFVDVMFHGMYQPADAKTGGLEVPEMTTTLFQAVEVLNFDRAIVATAPSSGQQALDLRYINGAQRPRGGPVPTLTLAVTPEQLAKVEAVKGRGTFTFSPRPKGEASSGNVSGEAMDYAKAMGIQPKEPAPPEPQPIPPYVTEHYYGRDVRAKYFDRYHMAYEEYVRQQKGGRARDPEADDATAADQAPAKSATPAIVRPKAKQPPAAVKANDAPSNPKPQDLIRAVEPTKYDRVDSPKRETLSKPQQKIGANVFDNLDDPANN